MDVFNVSTPKTAKCTWSGHSQVTEHASAFKIRITDKSSTNGSVSLTNKRANIIFNRIRFAVPVKRGTGQAAVTCPFTLAL